jgi:Cys-tRNA(Pro) deacylase
MSRSREKSPVTSAVRFLRQQQVSFTSHPYNYEEKGGTAVSARELGVEEYAVIKTLVMEDEEGTPLLVLMHGNRQVSTRELARSLKVKSIFPCHPDVANRHTGYKFQLPAQGTTSRTIYEPIAYP